MVFPNLNILEKNQFYSKWLIFIFSNWWVYKIKKYDFFVRIFMFYFDMIDIFIIWG